MDTKDRKKTMQPVIFAMGNDQCVWGRAGVIKPTKCVNAFDCLGCTLDQRVLAILMSSEKPAASQTTGRRECC